MAVAIAGETAQLDRDLESESGRAPRGRIALTGGDAASRRLRTRPPRRAPGARRQSRGPSRAQNPRRQPESRSARRSRRVSANFSPAHVLAGRLASRARDGAPRLGTPHRVRRVSAPGRRPATGHRGHGARVPHRGAEGPKSAPLTLRLWCRWTVFLSLEPPHNALSPRSELTARQRLLIY